MRREDHAEKQLQRTFFNGLLEEGIVLGFLQRQQRLVEGDLMVRFDAKRHVVRRALGALERLGTVKCKPNRGV